MDENHIIQIRNNPDFQMLVHKKTRLGWTLSIIMLVVYVAFILIIGFSPATFGKPVFPGSAITLGIPVGVFVIVFAFALTGIYVKQANSEFDTLTQKVVKGISQ